ncbi:MAG: D-alanine--D-alanine ligase family protein [Pirellulaceae bacterium]
MKIVMLHNDVSADISPSDLDVLKQRDVVSDALRRLGHQAEALSCTLDLSRAKTQLETLRPDVVFNLVESLIGTDRLMAAGPLLLDALHIPYTGVPTLALLTTCGKLTTKRRLSDARLPTAPWFTAETTGWQGLPWPDPGGPTPDSRAATTRLAPLIVKAIWEHASFHMDDDAIVSPASDAQLAELLRAREVTTGHPYFAEPYVEGREFNLSVLASESGPQVLPPAEIDFAAYPPEKPRIVGYQAKWDEASFEYHHTPRQFEFPPADRGLVAELSRLAIACWHHFGLRGYARVDFRVDNQGRPWILEVNPNPCLSLDAGFAAAIERAGMTYDEAIERIVQDAWAAADRHAPHV